MQPSEIKSINNALKLKSIALQMGANIGEAKTAVELKAKIFAHIGFEEPAEVFKKSDDKFVVFTYVGAGESSPQIIKFMGEITFRRGQPVKIENSPKNAFLLRKLAGNQVFIQGEIEEDKLTEVDENAKKDADSKRQDDVRINRLAKDLMDNKDFA